MSRDRRFRLPPNLVPRATEWLHRHLSSMSRGRAGLHLYRLVAQPVPDEPLLPPGRGQRIAVRPITAEESEALTFPRPRSVIRQRFRDGGQCLGAFRDDRLIGFLWLHWGTYQEDEVRCLFRPEPADTTAWDYDVWVDPAFRFSPAFAKLWDEAFTRLRSAGVTWTMSRVAAGNAGSLGAHGRLKARAVGSALFVRAGPLQLTVATARPWLHLAAGRRRQPTLIVRA